MKATIFSSYFEALALLLGKSAHHYFTATEFVAGGESACSRCFEDQLAEGHDEPLSAEVASTLVDYAANNGTVAGVEIAIGDEHKGYILLHYTHDGDVVRFVAFQ